MVEKRSRTFTAPSTGAAPRPKGSEGASGGRPGGQPSGQPGGNRSGGQRNQQRRQDGNRNRQGQGGRRQEPANTGLTNSESEKRERALRAAAARADEERRAQAEAEQRRIDDAARRKAEREEAARIKAEEEARLEAERKDREREAAEEKANASKPKAKPAAKTKPQAEPEQPPAPPVERANSKSPDQGRKKPLVREDELERAKRAAKPQPSKRAGGNDRRQSRLTVTSATRGDSERDRGPSMAAMRRRREKQRGKGPQTPKEKISREVTIPEAITVQELANRMAERAVDVIKLLMLKAKWPPSMMCWTPILPN